jgi:hypothetical protein
VRHLFQVAGLSLSISVAVHQFGTAVVGQIDRSPDSDAGMRPISDAARGGHPEPDKTR